MAGKRDTTPLFEVLSQGRRAEPHVPAGGVASEQPAQGGAGGGAGGGAEVASGAAKGAGLGEVPIRIVGGVVQMPLVYAAVAVAVALAAVLGAWTLGFQRGENEARSKQRLLESALGPGARVVEPGTSGGGTEHAAGQQPSPPIDAPRQQNTPQTNRPIPAVGQATYLVGAGGTEADPRLVMHNYLQLGSQIRASEIVSAVDFLSQRGLECFGVIDPRTRGRNDGPLYVLFAGLGFPSGEADSPEARRYREQVLAAGAAWKQAGGVKDFDDAGWVLYKP